MRKIVCSSSLAHDSAHVKYGVWTIPYECIGSIDQFRYIKIQPKTIDPGTGPWGINPTNSVVIPQSLALGSIVLCCILIYRNWSIRNWSTTKQTKTIATTPTAKTTLNSNKNSSHVPYLNFLEHSAIPNSVSFNNSPWNVSEIIRRLKITMELDNFSLDS